MQFSVNPDADNSALYVPPVAGASSLLLQNVGETDLYFHQGFAVKTANVAITGGPFPSGELTEYPENSTAPSALLAPGESVELNFSRPVWVHSGTANVEGFINVTPLE